MYENSMRWGSGCYTMGKLIAPKTIIKFNLLHVKKGFCCRKQAGANVTVLLGNG